MVQVYYGILGMVVPWYTIYYVVLQCQKTMVIFHGIPWYDHVVLPHGYTMVYHEKIPWFSGYGNTT